MSAQIPLPSQPSPHNPIPAEQGGAVSILLVEGNKTQADSISALLKSDGRSVRLCASPSDARGLIEQESFDIIISDLFLPDEGGISLMRQSLLRDPNTCVILMAQDTPLEKAIEALTMGACDFLVKPLRPEQLETTLRRALAGREKQRLANTYLAGLSSSHDEMIQRLGELNALYEAGKALSSTMKLRTLLDKILELSMSVTHAGSGSVMLLNESATYLTIAAAQGMDEKIAADVRLPVGESIAGHVASTGRPLLITNVENDERFRRVSKGRYGGSSLMCAPLVAKSKNLGVINLAHRTDNSVFSEQDLKLLVTFAAQAAVAIDDARAFSESARQLSEIRALQELGTRMAKVVSLENMRSLVFDTLRGLMPVEYDVWLHYNAKTHALKVVAAHGRNVGQSDSGKITINAAKVEEPTIRNPHLARLAFDNPDARDIEVRRALADLGAPVADSDALMVAPLAHDGTLEYLYCLVAGYIDSYSAHDRSLAEIIVSQAAVMYEKEKSLLNASRLMTMGNMISEISHDLRKPLTSIRGALGLLRAAVRKSETPEDLFSMLEEETDRLNEMVYELVDFSKPHKYETEKTDLRRLIMRSLELVAADLENRKISTRCSFSDNSWEAIVNKNQALEAILNIFTNAIDMMPSGGELTITGLIERLDYRSGEFLAIRIKDSGPGIKKDNLARVFTRYFTTKDTGAGLGLAVVERIMSAHGGEIAVTSEEGAGATFILYFPLSPNAGRAATASHSISTAPATAKPSTPTSPDE